MENCQKIGQPWPHIEKLSQPVRINFSKRNPWQIIPGNLLKPQTYSCNVVVPFGGPIGKPVKFRYGPAAVFGDEIRNCHWSVTKQIGKARKVDWSESQKTCHYVHVCGDGKSSGDYAWGFFLWVNLQCPWRNEHATLNHRLTLFK